MQVSDGISYKKTFEVFYKYFTTYSTEKPPGFPTPTKDVYELHNSSLKEGTETERSQYAEQGLPSTILRPSDGGGEGGSWTRTAGGKGGGKTDSVGRRKESRRDNKGTSNRHRRNSVDTPLSE